MPIELGSFSMGVVAGGMVVGLANHYLAKSRSSEERKIKEFNDAAAKFRSGIFVELEGIYPRPQTLSKDDYQKIKKSIPKIISIAQEFRIYLEDRKSFDAAVKEYSSYCKDFTWEQSTAWILYPSMRKDGEKPPHDIFYDIVKSLLSYAESK